MASRVTMTALRFALTRIAEEVCRSSSIVIRVAEAPFQPHSFYAVCIQFEVRAGLWHFLADAFDLSLLADGGPLILPLQQAAAVVDLAYRKEASWSGADKPQ